MANRKGLNKTGWDENGEWFLLLIPKEEKEENKANRIAKVLKQYNLP